MAEERPTYGTVDAKMAETTSVAVDAARAAYEAPRFRITHHSYRDKPVLVEMTWVDFIYLLDQFMESGEEAKFRADLIAALK